MTDRPQFDVLANMRPAPERQPSEAEVLRDEVATLRRLVRSALFIIDAGDGGWKSQPERCKGVARRWCEAAKNVLP